jgi:hypothetical protein
LKTRLWNSSKEISLNLDISLAHIVWSKSTKTFSDIQLQFEECNLLHCYIYETWASDCNQMLKLTHNFDTSLTHSMTEVNQIIQCYSTAIGEAWHLLFIKHEWSNQMPKLTHNLDISLAHSMTETNQNILCYSTAIDSIY